MGMNEWIAAGALGLIGVILLVLLLQYLRLRVIWQGLSNCREALRWARIWESENRELKRSLRAEQKRRVELEEALSDLQDSTV
ncbi:hypothetical protein H8F21_10845 [Pseudomonas sp. P66]|jgi:hypothetical protein|uniref:Uncharacterized protein n=2 Tax=Pseudomonas TaxID=286 RepID=A0ABS2BWQ2_9PSED|nr:hypothetical protein [Pseudomonas arcuscaelestis]MBM5458053.1 hypothetical protein [Pseudomonas arcuscaelestis]